jgi:iron complex outermembrane receptor protein
MNYQLSDKVTLTSATGYYDIDLDQCQNYENSFAVILPSCNVLTNKEFSEDLHLATDFDGPFNVTGGLYFASTKAQTGSLTYLFAGGFPLLVPAGSPGFPNGFGGPTTPAQVNNYLLTQKGKAYSAFLELSFKPMETLELNVGARYSKERKRLTDVRGGGGISEVFNPAIFKTVLDQTTVISTTPNALGYSLSKNRDSWKDFSPEATVTYRPSGDLTLFASYKQGFLSGGFNSSSVNFSTASLDLSYRPQRIDGFEAGVKSRVADGALLLNLAGYTYKIDDLQVVNFTNATSTIRNAAAGKVKGVEADFNYRTGAKGLSIHGAAAYNDAKYSSFPGAPCYNGQTPAQGCTIIAGNPTQDLAGKVVARAPKWNVSGGFSYDMPVGGSLEIGLSGDINHSSSFLTDATGDEAGRQPSYTLFDASLRVGDADDLWELSLVGRNLSNKFIYYASANVPFTGGGTGTPAGALGDRFASVGRGREILLRASYKFGQ